MVYHCAFSRIRSFNLFSKLFQFCLHILKKRQVLDHIGGRVHAVLSKTTNNFEVANKASMQGGHCDNQWEEGSNAYHSCSSRKGIYAKEEKSAWIKDGSESREERPWNTWNHLDNNVSLWGTYMRGCYRDELLLHKWTRAEFSEGRYLNELVKAHLRGQNLVQYSVLEVFFPCIEQWLLHEKRHTHKGSNEEHIV